MRHKIFIALCIVSLVFGVWFMSGRGREIAGGNWEGRIRETGGANAYSDFKDDLVAGNFSRSAGHMRLHSFGASLYEVEGAGGIGVCDSFYDFGCYHGYFSKAVSHSGDDVVADLADSCRARFGANSTGCEHGIGHGIMEYVGTMEIVRGLTLCEKTKQADPLYGCTSGLFMEFNLPITYDADELKVQVRPLDPSRPYFPCRADVPERFRASCYFEQSAWWGNVYEEEEKPGLLCAGAAKENERQACWRGWGSVVAEKAEYDVHRASALCNLVRDDEGAEHCLLGVAMRLRALPGREKDASDMCRMRSGKVTDECARLFTK
jgi:hypothetical protein